MKRNPEISIDLLPAQLIDRVAIQFRAAEPQDMNVFITSTIVRVSMEVPDHVV